MTEYSRPWRPFLSGALLTSAKDSVLAIASDIETLGSEKRPFATDPVASAMLFAYMARCDYGERYWDLAAECHATAVRTAADRPAELGLYGGLTGVGWLDAHLTGTVFDAEPEEETDLDQVLLERLSEPWSGHYDLIGGLVGIGLYGIERRAASSARLCLELVVNHLLDTAEEVEGCLRWHTPAERLGSRDNAERYPLGWYNLGMAHGIPGVIALLARLVSLGIDAERSSSALRATLPWLLNQRLDRESVFAFPNLVAPGEPPRGSRAAWCYGDPGVGISLLLASRALDDPDLERLAVDVTRRSLALPYRLTGVRDPGLCHGAAGLAQIAMRMHWHTSAPDFADLACTWLAITMAMRRHNQGVGGYLAWGPARLPSGLFTSGPMDWQAEASFLTGSAGIALSLLAATTNVAPEWDRLLLLS